MIKATRQGIAFNEGGRGLILVILWWPFMFYLCYWTKRFAPRLVIEIDTKP